MRDWESTFVDYENFEKWTVSRYWQTRNRYMLTARHELGFQLKEYCDKGVWHGAPENINRFYEDLQCEMILGGKSGIKITKNLLLPDVYLFEVNTQYTKDYKNYWHPDQACLMVKDKIFHAESKDIKDGYRYNFKG